MYGLKPLVILDPNRHNPVEGLRYGQLPLGRLLIVGLSHYGDKKKVERPNFTQEIVQQIIGNEKSICYFTKIAKLFTEALKLPWPEDEFRAEFYSRVAFYNYLPYPFGGPKEPYEKQLSNEAKIGFFFKVLDYYKPERVLVTGERLWCCFVSKRNGHSFLSKIDEPDLPLPFECADDESCCLYRRKDGGTTLVGAITHPSTAKFNKKRPEIVKWIRKFMVQSTS